MGERRRQWARELGLRNKRHGHASTDTRSGTYRSWECMKARCRNKNDPCYPDYGGRGITYPKRWEKFESFLADMGARPSGKTLDRIDVNRSYSIKNCRWATRSEQSRNHRGNRIVRFRGKKMTMVELSEITGVPYQRLHDRIVRRGWKVSDAVERPARKKW